MASKDPNSSSPPPVPAPATKNHRPTAKKETKSKPNKRKVIRPTEIVSPGDPPERKNHDRLQAVESSDDDAGSLDSSDEEDMDLSDEEEDEYDEEEDDEEEDGDDDDDVESIYLPDPTPKTVLPSQSHPTPAHRRRNTHTHNPRQQGTIVETRTQSSQWVVAQQQAPSREISVRGGTASRHQTVRREQQPPTDSRERGVSRGNNANAFRLNMSLDVNVNFSGLVTGRNLGFAGVSLNSQAPSRYAVAHKAQGQLSYAWGRSRQE